MTKNILNEGFQFYEKNKVLKRDIEMYQNDDKWVVAWIDESRKYTYKSEAFFTKADAENFAKKLKNEEDFFHPSGTDNKYNSPKI